MTDTGPSRRKLLAKIVAGTTGMTLLTGTTAGDDRRMPVEQSGPVEGAPYNEVDSAPATADYVEDAVNEYLNRPTNSYVNSNNVPQVAFDIETVTDAALEDVIYVAALAWARAIASGSPALGIQFRAYHAELGEPYDYAASFYLGQEMALNYVTVPTKEGHISEREYMQWAYSQLKRR